MPFIEIINTTKTVLGRKSIFFFASIVPCVISSIDKNSIKIGELVGNFNYVESHKVIRFTCGALLFSPKYLERNRSKRLSLKVSPHLPNQGLKNKGFGLFCFVFLF